MSIREATPAQRSTRGSSLGVGIIAAAVVFSACYYLQAVVLPILISYFLYVLLEPLVKFFEQRKLSRTLASSVLILLVVAASSLAGWGVYSTCARLANQVPQYSEKIKSMLSQFQEQAAKLQEGSSSILPETKASKGVQKVEVIESFGTGRVGDVLAGVNSSFELLTIAFFIPLLTLFFLLDKPYLFQRFKLAVGEKVPLEKIGEEVSQMMASFVLGNLIVGLLTALGFYILFAILGLENSVVLAIFAGFVNLIPVIGSILGGVLPALQAFMQFDTLAPLLIVMGGSIFLHFFIANFIMPKVVGSKTNVNASAATIGLLFWGWLWGTVGLFLAIPLTALVRILLAATPAVHRWADLIAENNEPAA